MNQLLIILVVLIVLIVLCVIFSRGNEYFTGNSLGPYPVVADNKNVTLTEVNKPVILRVNTSGDPYARYTHYTYSYSISWEGGGSDVLVAVIPEIKPYGVPHNLIAPTVEQTQKNIEAISCGWQVRSGSPPESYRYGGNQCNGGVGNVYIMVMLLKATGNAKTNITVWNDGFS